MADGKTHNFYNRFGWGIIVPTSIVILIYSIIAENWQGILFAILSPANFYITNYLSPDADLLGITSEEGRAMRKSKKFTPIGGLIGIIWVNWWTVYAYIMSYFGGHRGWSHAHIVGTLSRMIHFNIPPLALLIIGGNWLKDYFGWNSLFYELYLDIWIFPYLLSQFFAWTISDEIHYFLDSNLFKKYGRRIMSYVIPNLLKKYEGRMYVVNVDSRNSFQSACEREIKYHIEKYGVKPDGILEICINVGQDLVFEDVKIVKAKNVLVNNLWIINKEKEKING